MKSLLLNLHEVVIVLTILETLLLCIALGILPGGRKQPRRLLQIFFLLVVGTLSTTLIIWNTSFQAMAIANYPVIPALLSACLLLQGPVLFFYLGSLSQEIDLRHWRHGIHLLPAVLAVGVTFAYDLSIYDWLPWHWASLSGGDRAALAFVWFLVKCSPLIYVFACFYTEYRLRKQLQQMYSTISERELRLADLVLGGFFIHWLWSFIAYFLGGYVSGETNDLLGIINNYLTVLLINALFLFGWRNTRELVQQDLVAITEPEKDRLQEIPQVDDKLQAVERGIGELRLHLESQINLERFADQIGVKARELSTIINTHYQQNFFEFINSQRVEEAKRLLASPECAGDTVLDILYKSGFNSQSAFHRFFKRMVGMTPSEYRKQAIDLKRESSSPLAGIHRS
ncbi:AraC family transcriptional regulator [Cellvibrio sp. OA-2007]|uniref:AraC family transcriptional regulator n=1 Tax=Cellvibrio sp. OA-2007 TaxID=529823 RepID=UPI0007858305|nr:AraC family transcriptional regulator [Cellvibrio sp. OA-2007]